MASKVDKETVIQVLNTKEFKEWLISKRWFGNKSKLSDLQFEISLKYFEMLSESIFLTVIEISQNEYSNAYFLPLITYNEIQNILEQTENQEENVTRLKKKSFTHDLNLIEAEYCHLFWKTLLFEKEIIEEYKYPEKFTISLHQLAEGTTTNLLFILEINDITDTDKKPDTFVLKSYKIYSENIETVKLSILNRNNFPNAPKIKGTVKVQDIPVIGILENVPNEGDIGGVYWNELNDMIFNTFKEYNKDFSRFKDNYECNKLIMKHCPTTFAFSSKIGSIIESLHEALIIQGDPDNDIMSIDSPEYLNIHSDKLNSTISEIREHFDHVNNKEIYTSSDVKAILSKTMTTVENLKNKILEPKLKLQPIHHDLHMSQILYNKDGDGYNFYIIDYEGDPQRPYGERRKRSPVERDFASLLRALSYIKYNIFFSYLKEIFNCVNPEEMLISSPKPHVT